MSRVIGGARPWNESEARVGQRHTPRPLTSALIDARRQSNFSLRASFFAVNIATAATPDSHPDCRALLIQIVALQSGADCASAPPDDGVRTGSGILSRRSEFSTTRTLEPAITAAARTGCSRPS